MTRIATLLGGLVAVGAAFPAQANHQTVIPWYSAASAGWAFGTAVGNANSKARHRMAKSSTL